MLGERDIPMVNINTQVQRNLAQIFICCPLIISRRKEGMTASEQKLER